MHGLFGDTTGSLFNTGTVTAELFRLGVPMANLEMIQYHPTTVPIGGKRMLISEAARGEGGRLFAMRDGKPWYFMEEKYPELGNLMPRDITAREIWTVRQQSEVFLDMTGLAPDVYEKKLSGLAEDCRVYLGEDIRKEPISVSPGIHYFMGGIRVDAQHRTGVQNLYAAGECCAPVSRSKPAGRKLAAWRTVRRQSGSADGLRRSRICIKKSCFDSTKQRCPALRTAGQGRAEPYPAPCTGRCA